MRWTFELPYADGVSSIFKTTKLAPAQIPAFAMLAALWFDVQNRGP
jgi:hypothetical protein